jgi:ATP-dependent DNA ligase
MIKAMLAKDAKKPLNSYLDDDKWIAEPKVNGQRMILQMAEKGMSAFNRQGQELTLKKDWPLIEAYAKKPWDMGTWIFDGEYIDKLKTYFVFDVVRTNKGDHKIEPWYKRRKILDDTVGSFAPPGMTLVPYASTVQEKIWLYEQTEKNGHEGVVFKNVFCGYIQADKTNWVKFKHFKTLDAVVIELNRGGKQQAVTLGLYDDNGQLKRVGGLKIPMWVLHQVQVGTVVEVQYQYATRNNNLYIPKFQFIRDDKPAETCYTSQLQYENTNIIKGIQ